MFGCRGGARNALHPGLNQWTSASLIKFKINAITLGLITIEIYMARTSLDPCCSTASTGPGSAPVWMSQSLDKPIVSNQIDGSYSITWNLFNGDEYLSGFELNSKQSKAASSTTSLILYATTHFSKSTWVGVCRGRNVCRGPQLGWSRWVAASRRGTAVDVSSPWRRRLWNAGCFTVFERLINIQWLR